jgi:hypothetical protein
MHSFGTLRVSLVGLEQYCYQGPDMEQLDLLVKYGSIIQGRLFAKDDNARPCDEIDSTFFDLPEARDRKKAKGKWKTMSLAQLTRHHGKRSRRSAKDLSRWSRSRR